MRTRNFRPIQIAPFLAHLLHRPRGLPAIDDLQVLHLDGPTLLLQGIMPELGADDGDTVVVEVEIGPLFRVAQGRGPWPR